MLVLHATNTGVRRPVYEATDFPRHINCGVEGSVTHVKLHSLSFIHGPLGMCISAGEGSCPAKLGEGHSTRRELR